MPPENSNSQGQQPGIGHNSGQQAPDIDDRTSLENEILAGLEFEEDEGQGEGEGADFGEDSGGELDSQEQDSNIVGTSQQQTQQTDPQGQQGQPTQDRNPRADSQGNIVGPDGKIIARAGNERRYWSGWQQERARSEALSRQSVEHRQLLQQASGMLQDAHGQIKGFQEALQLPKQLGLSETEYAEALHLASQIKANPIQGVKILLTRLAENGTNIGELGVDTGGIDVKALSDSLGKKIEEATKPIKDQYESQQRNEQVATEAQKQIQGFFSQHPEARQYASVLGRMMNDPRLNASGNMTMREAWFQLQNHLLRSQQSNPQTRQTGKNSRAMPSGRPNAGVTGNNRVDNSPVGVDRDYGDILKDVMKDYRVTQDQNPF